MAAQVELQLRSAELNPAFLQRAFDRTKQRSFRSRIYGIVKTRTNLDVYVTNRSGIVIFDTAGKDLGQDFSRWNDVARTLRGEYGARSSRSDLSDPASGALYVAAPIRWRNEIVGVLTVVKPKDSVTPFVELARHKFIQAGLVAASGMILLILLISLWVTAPIERLRRHVEALRESPESTIALPPLGSGEIAALGRAFQEMREKLESRAYVERYVQSMTHEIKSPLAAIRGAAELLQGRLRPADRQRFLRNIEAESGRIAAIVQRMLDLASLENRSELRNPEQFNVVSLLHEIVDSLESERRAKRLRFQWDLASDRVECIGERFLLRQAIENIFRNAVEFSPAKGLIRIMLSQSGDAIALGVEDQGPGIPAFAIGRVFERFYSLARPDTGRKSTGLGLPFAKEVLQLHGGECTLTSPIGAGGGTRALLRWPIEKGERPRSEGRPGRRS